MHKNNIDLLLKFLQKTRSVSTITSVIQSAVMTDGNVSIHLGLTIAADAMTTH